MFVQTICWARQPAFRELDSGLCLSNFHVFLLAPPWEKQDMLGLPEIFNFNLSSLDPQFTFQVSCVPSRGRGCSRFGTWGCWSKTGPWNSCMLWPFGVFIGFGPHFSIIKFRVQVSDKAKAISWPEMDIQRKHQL